MAKALDRLEETLERVMKDSITQRLGGRLHPVEIARKLVHAVDANQTITAQRILAPNIFTVYLNPADLETLQPIQMTLEREFATYLAQTIEEGGLSAVGYPRVELMAAGDVPRRKVRVVSRIAEGQPAEETAQEPDNTVRLQLPLARTMVGRAWFSIPGPEGRELTCSIKRLPFSIGRALDNDLVLEGRAISRHHAQLQLVQGRPCLLDLGSSNGTLLNGRRITETVLKDGDAVSLGLERLIFRWEEG